MSKFCMSLRMTFSNSISYPLIDNYGKGVAVKIGTVFERVYHVACRRVMGNSTF